MKAVGMRCDRILKRKTAMPTNMLDSTKVPRLFSLSSFIAWLSLLLLATAWGRTLDERWQGIWARAGAFGLAAAVGLGSLEKARLLREKCVHGLASRVSFERFEGRLTRLNELGAALALIDGSISRLTKHVASERRRQAANPARGKSPLALDQFPLEVIPVEMGDDAFDLGSAHSIAGSLHRISSRVVTFEHDEAFTERVVLLTFTLAKSEKLCFVINVVWTHTLPDRFVSSGAVMAVGVPADQVSETAFVGSSQEARRKSATL
jgi:hypothetical protein